MKNLTSFILTIVAILAMQLLLCRPAVAAADDDASRLAAIDTMSDIPHLDGIAIDGDAAAWGTRGLQINALADMTGRIPPAAEFAAAVRLGWDIRGLLLLVNLHAAPTLESDHDDQLWTGDSIELFLSSKFGGHDMVQAILSPGLTAAHPQLRRQLVDHRDSPRLKSVPPSIQAARTVAGGSCVVQALLPWDQLGIEPRPGQEIAFQIVVNHTHGTATKSQAVWFPAVDTHMNTRSMHRLRLADSPSPAIDLAVAGDYEHFRHVRLGINAAADLAGQTVQIRNGAQALGEGKLEADGRHAYANLTLPMPAPQTTYEQLQIICGDRPPLPFLLPDARPLRQDAFRESRLRFGSYVFAEATFPGVDFEQPSAVEDAIGHYTLKTDFYDADFNPVSAAAQPGRYGAVVTITADTGFVAHRFVTLYRAAKPWRGWGDDPVACSMEFPPAVGVDPAVVQEQNDSVREYLSETVLNLSFRTDRASAVLLAGLHELPPGSGPLPHHLGPSNLDDDWWYALRTKLGLLEPYQYVTILPPGYDQDPAKRWPLMIFLHGSDGHASDFADIRRAGLRRRGLDESTGLPFVIVCAQQPPDRQWWNPRQVNDLLDTALAKYRIDADHVYLTGLSMGGFGTWETAFRHPDRFAAIVPIAGGAHPDDAPTVVDLPTWIFHGQKDPTVPVRLDLRMADTLTKLHARFKMSIDPEAGHDSWTNAYAADELYDWMLQQTRGHPAQPPVK